VKVHPVNAKNRLTIRLTWGWRDDETARCAAAETPAGEKRAEPLDEGSAQHGNADYWQVLQPLVPIRERETERLIWRRRGIADTARLRNQHRARGRSNRPGLNARAHEKARTCQTNTDGGVVVHFPLDPLTSGNENPQTSVNLCVCRHRAHCARPHAYLCRGDIACHLLLQPIRSSLIGRP